MVAMKRMITGLSASTPMTLGDLRQFVASLDALPDEATVKARVGFRKRVRSITVEEDDIGFREYLRAVEAKPSDPSPGGRKAKDAKQTTSV
jgi:hypothetical protein